MGTATAGTVVEAITMAGSEAAATGTIITSRFARQEQSAAWRDIGRASLSLRSHRPPDRF